MPTTPPLHVEPEYPLNSVLIAEDLTPSNTAVLDRSRVAGFCTSRGGATSHVAILARSLGLPALAGIEPDTLQVPNGTLVILDGNQGTLRLHVSAEEVARVRAAAQDEAERRRKEDLAHAQEPPRCRGTEYGSKCSPISAGSADHSHAGCGRRQAIAVPADSEGG